MKKVIFILILLLISPVFAEEPKTYTEEDLKRYGQKERIPMDEKIEKKCLDLAVDFMRRGMLNPDAFKPRRYKVEEGGKFGADCSVFLQFTASNAFGGIITGTETVYIREGEILGTDSHGRFR